MVKKIKIGSVVTLKKRIWNENKRYEKQSTVVQGFLSDVKGGVVLAERLMNFSYWNADDLEVVK